MLSEREERRWQRTESAIAFAGEISLRGLRERVVAELLFGLQQRTAEGTKTKPSELRRLADHLRAQQARSIETARLQGLINEVQTVASHFVAYARRQFSTPETERLKDVWDTAVFGYSGLLRFTAISQRWLREAVKVLIYNDLPLRRGKSAKQHCQVRINVVAMLSESLRLQRADGGADPRLLARTDMSAFLNRMGYLHAQGQLTANKRVRVVREVRRALSHLRALGLAKPGAALAGLGEDFTLFDADIPAEPEDNALGRDLPIEVVRVLCAYLEEFEAHSGVVMRTAVELLIDTGRRPDEICQLRLDCLERDGHGQPVLVYDNIKADRLDRRLPIPEASAAVIVAQQQRVRAWFPDEPAAQLKLLPTSTKNPHGRKAITESNLGTRHRLWVDALPEIEVPVTVIAEGTSQVLRVVFDKSRIVPYAYRHTYAQRHADAGVAVDVLRELMDHRHMVTSQGYYRVGETRRRAAVEKVASMQFDRHGARLWRRAEVLLDQEHLRRAVGTVAVPYGTCSEPTNVAAGGGECPVRFRCVGCAHFSTDISYLADLQAYLDGLLRSRERLTSAFPAEDWARAEAMPSQQEIDRIRRLITRIGADVGELPEPDRAEIAAAVAVVRRTRNTITSLGLPQTRQPIPDLRPDRTATR
ncbi:site-specific integrase [Nocardia goodfellowii]